MRIMKGYPRLSPHGMWYSPHKRGQRKKTGPTGGLTSNGPINNSGDSGNKPFGKKKKNERIKAQPPGFPQGRHKTRLEEGEACHCGGCNNGT